MLFRCFGCGRELGVVGVLLHQAGVQKGATILRAGERIGDRDSEAGFEDKQNGGDDDVVETHVCLRDE